MYRRYTVNNIQNSILKTVFSLTDEFYTSLQQTQYQILFPYVLTVTTDYVCIPTQLYQFQYQLQPQSAILSDQNSQYYIDTEGQFLFIYTGDFNLDIEVQCPEEQIKFNVNNPPELVCKQQEKQYVNIYIQTSNQLPEESLCVITQVYGNEELICNNEISNNFSINITKNQEFQSQILIKTKYIDQKIPYFYYYLEDYQEIEVKNLQVYVDNIKIVDMQDFFMSYDLLHVLGLVQYKSDIVINNNTYFNGMTCDQSMKFTEFEPDDNDLIILTNGKLYSNSSLDTNQTFVMHSIAPVSLFTNCTQQSDYEQYSTSCENVNFDLEFIMPIIDMDDCIYYLYDYSKNKIECKDISRYDEEQLVLQYCYSE